MYLHLYYKENGFNKKGFRGMLSVFFSGSGVDPLPLIGDMSPKKLTFFKLSLSQPYIFYI